MPAVAKQWHLVPHNRAAIEQLAAQLRVSPVVAQLLLNRQHQTKESAKRFLEAPLAGLHRPETLPGIQAAVEVLHEAIQAKKKIAIYGDYDVDGVTGTAILLGLFQRLRVPVEFYVPHRLEEGYGLNRDALHELASNGVQVVVTVDCGIASLAEADEAKALGLQLIVTDHHEMKERLPNATVCVHPRLPGTNYPFGGLSGAGVAFKLAWSLAVRHCGSEKVTTELRDYLMDSLCLATLGLVADVVPLQDENRILVKAGLSRMNTKAPRGIQVLLESAKHPPERPIKSDDIGYRLAPRINAAGRLGCARLVVEMFTTNNAARAKEVAEFLDTQNGKRQAIERQMVLEARAMYDESPHRDASAVVLASNQWHAGVVGIVAGRMVEYTGKPTVLLAIRETGDLATGSGRSIPGFELHTALQACDDLLEGHGGHAMAVGVKVLPTQIDAFRERFQQYAAEHFPRGVVPAPMLQLDAELPLSALTYRLVEELDWLEPYGADNPRPRFLAGNLKIVGEPRRIGQGERHLNFRVAQGSTKMRVVAWGMGDRLDELLTGGGECCLAFVPKINEYNGNRSIELEAVDFQVGPVANLV